MIYVCFKTISDGFRHFRSWNEKSMTKQTATYNHTGFLGAIVLRLWFIELCCCCCCWSWRQEGSILLKTLILNKLSLSFFFTLKLNMRMCVFWETDIFLWFGVQLLLWLIAVVIWGKEKVPNSGMCCQLTEGLWRTTIYFVHNCLHVMWTCFPFLFWRLKNPLAWGNQASLSNPTVDNPEYLTFFLHFSSPSSCFCANAFLSKLRLWELL